MFMFIIYLFVVLILKVSAKNIGVSDQILMCRS